MIYRHWSRTDRGLKRQTNQDSILVNPDLGIYVLADGMGGHSGGEVASALAVQIIEEVFTKSRNSPKSPRERIELAYKEASRRIYDMAAKTHPELAGMGTTLVMIFVHEDKVYFGNVGDSRSYLYRGDQLWQLSEDHSVINQQIRSGTMSEDQAKVYVGKNVITRSVGYEREVEVDVLEREALADDLYLLCSDGLSGMVNDHKIRDILREAPPEIAVDECMKSALYNGGDDNVSLILLKVEGFV
jgi:PPM family protein phosphatase